MKKNLKNIIAVGFLVLFLPYTATLLAGGRERIHQEELLPELEYQVLDQLLDEDYSWMEDGTLELMAVICRTECVYKNFSTESTQISPELYGDVYERVYKAVTRTRGQVIMIDGAYRELPYHAVSAGSTRDGRLLGEEFSYVLSVSCPLDMESDSYLQICTLTQKEMEAVLGTGFSLDQAELDRDHEGYVNRISCSGSEWNGEEFRTLLHLASSCFWMEESEDGVRITVRGNGHGFGISLYTANRMVQEGAEMTEIIHKFYQDAECITIP